MNQTGDKAQYIHFIPQQFLFIVHFLINNALMLSISDLDQAQLHLSLVEYMYKIIHVGIYMKFYAYLNYETAGQRCLSMRWQF